MLRTQSTHRLRGWQQQLATQEKVMTLVDPVSIMKRGFTQTYVNGKLLSQVKPVPEGSQLRTVTHDSIYTSILQKHQIRSDGKEES